MIWHQLSPMVTEAHGTPASSRTIPLDRTRHLLVTNQESQQIFAKTSSMSMLKMALDIGMWKNQEFHVSGSSFYCSNLRMIPLHNHFPCNDVA